MPLTWVLHRVLSSSQHQPPQSEIRAPQTGGEIQAPDMVGQEQFQGISISLQTLWGTPEHRAHSRSCSILPQSGCRWQPGP